MINTDPSGDTTETHTQFSSSYVKHLCMAYQPSQISIIAHCVTVTTSIGHIEKLLPRLVAGWPVL